MSKRLGLSGLEVRARIDELRKNRSLFSYRDNFSTANNDQACVFSFQQGVRPGGIVEWLVDRDGAGAFTLALQMMAQRAECGIWAIVDPAGECYLPSLLGWGIDPGRVLILRPATRHETCWSIEQCLRCAGVSCTWAWVDPRIPERVSRRWQIAAEVGGGVGMFFRSVEARRQPSWADLRLLVTPRPGSRDEAREVCVEVLYRRGGLGGDPQAWEIDHAAGHVRLVPQMADPAIAGRAARS